MGDTDSLIVEEDSSDQEDSDSGLGTTELELEAPPDRYNAVYVIFLLLGLGSLLPWNFLITAESYWMYKLRPLNGNDSDPEMKTPLQVQFPIYLTMGTMIPTLVFQVVAVLITTRVSEWKRMVLSQGLIILLFILVLLLVLVNTDSWQMVFFALTMILVGLINAVCAIFQCGSFGIAGMLPPRITQAFLSGQALGGVVAALARVVTLAFGWSILSSTFCFFLLAILILIIALLGYLNLHKLEYYKFFKDRCKEDSPLLRAINEPGCKTRSSMFEILKKIETYAVCAGSVFGITLTVFPSMCVLFVSHGTSPWHTTYFMPVACFLLYNSSDFIGRTVGGLIMWPKIGSRLIPLFCALRIGLLPLILLTNLQPRHHLPVLLSGEYWFIVLVAILGFTNGYMALLSMAYGPNMVAAQDQEMAGSIMSFFLGLGLAIGCIFSNVIVNIL